MASKFEPRPESRMPSFFNGVMRSGVEHLAVTLDDASYQIGFFATLLDEALDALKLLCRHHQHHADPHVEGPHHVVLRNVADLLHVIEHGQDRPGAKVHDGGSPL